MYGFLDAINPRSRSDRQPPVLKSDMLPTEQHGLDKTAKQITRPL